MYLAEPTITVRGPKSTDADLQFSLEEPKLVVPSSSSSSRDRGYTLPPQIRDDFVYIPHIDQTRDADLLASQNMPDHFLEQIRFERGAAIKFLTSLHRSLKK